jgi:hypothetical protein
VQARPRDFQGTARFQLRRRLGEGGMGVVWEALDRERLTPVALKTLRSLAPDALYRFKHEFRALQDLAHPNLVSLGELIEEGGQWFFTMELVRGVSLLRWVRPADELDEGEPRARTEPSALSSPAEDARALSSPATEPTAAPAPARVTGGGFDEPRLRAAFAQLAEGLAALHARGLVHRDVKPSNVLVATGGRVVVLDFGVVADVSERGDGAVVGTAAYMAPEQAAGGAVGPAADWYALGVVLYRALTGRLPFCGTRAALAVEKVTYEVTPPMAVAPDVPADLDALCRDLMRVDPAARPSGDEVLRRLGASTATAVASRPPRFVGRARELDQLRAALAESRRRGVTVLVHGESGVGKSAVVRRFVEELAASGGAGRDETVVLSGRCYERESVHYKAVDGAVDALTRWLGTLPPDEVRALLPSEIALAVELFPVLQRVDALARAPEPTEVPEDPPELRARAFLAWRQLLRAIAARQPLVLAVDDLHWADADSLALLAELMRAPEAPRLLLLATMRDESGDGPAAVAARLGGDVRRLPLLPLPPAEARELAADLLGDAEGEGPLSAAVIAAEAHGHPLFIDELVRHKRLHGASLANPPLQLDDALRVRIDRLDHDARRLLELVAVAGAPLEQATAAAAAAIDFSAFFRMTTQLKTQNLVRTSGVHPSDAIEPYHDRVREAVLRHLDVAARKMRHGRLALALEASRQADAQALALHFAEAGDRERAARYTSLAAEEAARALAFDRAATLHRTALALAPPGSASRRRLAVLVAEALANAGRGAEAARAYDEAAALHDPDAAGPSSSLALVHARPPRGDGHSADDERTALALELKRRAAEQYLRGGHVDEGMAAVQHVLGAVGLSMPGTPLGALASLLYHRARVRLRGLGFRERTEGDVPPELLRRLDTCFSVAVGMGLVDTVRGADFQSRGLLLALRAGEPQRVTRALAFEAAHAAAGGSARARSRRLLEAATALAARLAAPEIQGVVAGSAGIVAFLEGRFAESLQRCDEAVRLFRDRCIGAAWETDSAQAFGLWALFYLGDTVELMRRVPQAIREAEERGDLYAATNLRIGELNFVHLLADDVAAARAAAAAATRTWSRQGFHHQHWDMLLAEATIDLYAGEPAEAWARVERTWPSLRKSLLLMIQLTRIEALHLRGRVALALATVRQGRERARLLAQAERAARRLGREGVAWSAPLAALLDGGIRHVRGDSDGARTALRAAASGFDGADMALWAACARARLGPLVDGDEGRALAAGADAWLRAHAVAAPARVVTTLAPGFA